MRVSSWGARSGLDVIIHPPGWSWPAATRRSSRGNPISTATGEDEPADSTGGRKKTIVENQETQEEAVSWGTVTLVFGGARNRAGI